MTWQQIAAWLQERGIPFLYIGPLDPYQFPYCTWHCVMPLDPEAAVDAFIPLGCANIYCRILPSRRVWYWPLKWEPGDRTAVDFILQSEYEADAAREEPERDDWHEVIDIFISHPRVFEVPPLRLVERKP